MEVRKVKRKPFRVMNYFGSKVASAKNYPEPQYDTIIEPFCGGAGYSLYHREKQVYLYDINEDVVDCWKWLIQASSKDVLDLPLLQPGEMIPESLSRGQKLVLGWSVSLVSANPQRFLVPSSKDVPGSFWCHNRRASLAKLVDEIRHWKVCGAMYSNLANRKATWFCDPPYQAQEGRAYPYSVVDYKHLGKWCKSRDGQVIVCEQEGADWLPFRTSHVTPGGLSPATAKRVRNQEVIWTNDS